PPPHPDRVFDNVNEYASYFKTNTVGRAQVWLNYLRSQKPNVEIRGYPNYSCGEPLVGQEDPIRWLMWKTLGMQELSTNCLSTSWATTVTGDWPFTALQGPATYAASDLGP